jgi:hypothetical protein
MIMHVGLLWYDDDSKRAWFQKVDDAAQRYCEKFGVYPDICYMNPATLPADQAVHRRLHIVLTEAILPNHFWVGIAESQEACRAV